MRGVKPWPTITADKCPACGSPRILWGRWLGPHKHRREGACAACWQRVQQVRPKLPGFRETQREKLEDAILTAVAEWLGRHSGRLRGVYTFLACTVRRHRSTIRKYVRDLVQRKLLVIEGEKIGFGEALAVWEQERGK